ncbi:MAG: tRNA(adenine34) deaminase [Cryomorphaceae bacterium]|jgi:tRNA(adenine34) deaminase
MKQDDLRWMSQAMGLAAQAQELDEVPVGALIVRDGEMLGSGFNAPIRSHDASAHAEIQAIRAACAAAENYRIPNTTLYVTLEPCAMCAGAIVHARISRVVIAAKEPRAGAAGSVLNLLQNEQLNHRCELEFGVMQEQSASMLKSFFKARRNKLVS